MFEDGNLDVLVLDHGTLLFMKYALFRAQCNRPKPHFQHFNQESANCFQVTVVILVALEQDQHQIAI